MDSDLLTIVVGITTTLVSLAYAELSRRGTLWSPSRKRVRSANRELLQVCTTMLAANNLNADTVVNFAASKSREWRVNRNRMLTHAEIRDDLMTKWAVTGALTEDKQALLDALERRGNSLAQRGSETTVQKRYAAAAAVFGALAVGVVAASVARGIALRELVANDELIVLLIGISGIAIVATLLCVDQARRFAAKTADRKAADFNEVSELDAPDTEILLPEEPEVSATVFSS